MHTYAWIFVDFVLEEGKLHITALHNTYSEGRRSQFTLASPSYLGLDGECHFDLQMKQSAFFKVAENFTFSVRGPIKEPKYSFKLKEE